MFGIAQADFDTENFTDDFEPEVHKTYVELYELEADLESREEGWKERGRWMKYEETAEGVDRHWGPPHVPCLHTAAVLALRRCVQDGLVLLDAKAKNWAELESELRVALVKQIGCTESEASVAIASLRKRNIRIPEAINDTGSVLRKLSLAATGAIKRTRKGTKHLLTLVEMDENPQPATVPAPLTTTKQQKSEQQTEKWRRQATSDPTTISRHEPPKHRAASVVSLHPEVIPEKKISKIGATLSLIMAKGDQKEKALEEYQKAQQSWIADELTKTIPEGSEAVQVYSGVIKGLTRVLFGMVRLGEASVIPELLQAPIPVKFLFFVLGPPIVADMDYHQIGRAIATLCANPVFKDAAYSGQNKEDMIKGLDGFLDLSILIPPGRIDLDDLHKVDDVRRELRRRELRQRLSEHARKESARLRIVRTPRPSGEPNGTTAVVPGAPKMKPRGDPLNRTGRFFGGLVKDLQYRLPWYKSDILDAFNVQCLTTIIFIFFAMFAPAITFGDLLDKSTKHQLGVTEMLITVCVSGVIWGFFSCQPLLCVGATGPVLVFEGALFGMCESMGLDYLTTRWWTGFWVLIFGLTTVAFEGSKIFAYFTAYTEDVFASLISMIFIGEAIKFLIKTWSCSPVMALQPYLEPDSLGLCHVGNASDHGTLHHDLHDIHNRSVRDVHGASLMSLLNATVGNATAVNPHYQHCKDCADHVQEPNQFLLAGFLLLLTFSIAILLRMIKDSKYFGRTLRRALGNFGVLIAIAIVWGVAYFAFPTAYIARLKMRDRLTYTDVALRSKNGHGFFVEPLYRDGNKFGYFFAIIPGFLLYILLFLEVEITQLLLAKKERGMRKGMGFHWDVLLISGLTFVCAIVGIPWPCSAPVQSVANMGSLTVMKRTAPGEKPAVERVIEQRLTCVAVAILIGACAFIGSVLKYLPQATLFGVFLYLGVMNLVPIHLIQRLVLLMVPQKYFPKVPFTQEVGMWRMHLYTAIQALALALVYLVKHYKVIAMLFPFAIVLVAVFRLFAVSRIFTKQELAALDEIEESEDEEDDAVAHKKL